MIGVPYIDVSGTGNDDVAVANAITAGAMLTTSRPLTLRQPVDLRRLVNPRFSIIGTGPAAMPINTGAINNASVFYYRAPAGNPGLSGFHFEGLDVYGNGSTGQTLVDIAGDGTNAGEINYLVFRDSRVWSMANGLIVQNLSNLNIDGLATMGVDNPIKLVNAGQSVLNNLQLEQGKGTALDIAGTDPTHVHTEEGCFLNNVNVAVFGGIGLYVHNHGWGEVSNYEFTSVNVGLILNSVSNWRFGIGAFAGTPTTPAAQMDAACSLISFVGSSFQLSSFGLVMAGQQNGVTGCQFNNNTNVDLMMQGATASAVVGNRFLSFGQPWSVVEDANANGNRYVGNIAAKAASVKSQWI